ncbi:cysteine desulfurase family protein [Phytoactinopolyspora alkaliphila]|uniref:cysteine desulfurase family protein n=1 Tax=Phytoactinopolyspora alkaliphila TaxID=1783498 RepID=UPI001C2077E7
MSAAHPGLANGPIYLDYNATTPVDPRVAGAMGPFLDAHFGNPSSAHAYGEEPRLALAQAHAEVARLIGAPAGGIVFTGSGSEANNLAIRGAIIGAGTERPHVITQVSEHPSVIAACRAAERLHHAEVTYLRVDKDGLVDPRTLAAALTPETNLVSIMHANNETGVIQPVAELARMAHEHGALFHTDAAQTVGKMPVDVAELEVDLLTVVGHKMYAPKGVGALYVRPGLSLEPLVYGGGQENDMRSGTENVAAVVALGLAAELAAAELADNSGARLRALRDRLHENLEQRLPRSVRLNGHVDQRLPHVLNVSIAGVRGEDLLAVAPGVAASTGSACHTGRAQASPVLTAMGCDDERSMSALRFSLGRWSTSNDADRAADLIAAAHRRLVE